MGAYLGVVTGVAGLGLAGTGGTVPAGVTVDGTGVDGTERRSGEGGEHGRVLADCFGNALASGQACADELEGITAVGFSAAVDVVFDYVADQSNEPQYNPQIVRAEKITPGSVSEGTRFRSAAASRGRTTEMLIGITRYGRPMLLASATTMQQANISYTLSFEPAAGGTRTQWSAQVRPNDAFRLFGPVIAWMGMRQERRIWASLKKHIEQHRQSRKAERRSALPSPA